MRVVVAGASGLIGSALTRRLRARGDEVIRLVRREATADDEASWDPERGRIDATVPAAIDGADAVVNLAGASIGRLPWTRAYRREIRASRVMATRTIVEAIRASSNPPAALINASAAGFYGSRPGMRLTEESPAGTGFLSNVVQQWEWEANRAEDATRVVTARSGIVIATNGVLKPLMLLTRLGLAGPLAGGRQVWPWIDLDDEVNAFVHLIDGELAGPVNLVAPIPATAGAIGKHLASRLHRPYWLPAPRFALELALGAAANDLLLTDARIIPHSLTKDGFSFTRPTVEEAIDAALARG